MAKMCFFKWIMLKKYRVFALFLSQLSVILGANENTEEIYE